MAGGALRRPEGVAGVSAQDPGGSESCSETRVGAGGRRQGRLVGSAQWECPLGGGPMVHGRMSVAVRARFEANRGLI